MAADILYGKGIIHVIPADVILDHKDGGIFRLGIPCIFKILSGFFFQRFMKLFVGKSIVQGVHDQILFFVKPGFYLIFFSGRGKRIKQLIIKITDLVGHKCVITAVIPEKFLKKLNTVCFLSGKEVFGKSIFRRLQGIRNRSFWGKLFYGVFCKKCFFRKEKAILQKDHGGSVGLINSGNISYRIAGSDQMFSTAVILPGNIASYGGKCSRGRRIASIYMVDQILYSFFHKETFQVIMFQKTGNIIQDIFQKNTG